VRSFSVMAYVNVAQTTDGALSMQSLLTSISLELSGLNTYACVDNVPMTRGLVSSIAAKCARSLTYLCFSMTRSSSWMAGISTHLNRLTSLKTLKIVIHKPCSELHRVLQNEVALAIPTVTVFAFLVRCYRDGTHAVFSYLARCRLHPKASFLMRLGSSDDTNSPVNAATLFSFFDGHQLARIVLCVDGFLLEGLASRIMRAQHLMLHWTDLPLALLATGHFPTHMTISCRQNSSDDETEAFWTFLDSIPGMSDRGNTPMTISIITNNTILYSSESDFGKFFLWSDGEKDQEEAKFIGRLVAVALRLEKKGIFIVDRQSRRVNLAAPRAEGLGTLSIPTRKHD
jgi:hypothetical protein